MYVGAPAPALSPSWDNGTWFKTFANQVDHSSFDFIPLHVYWEWSGTSGGNGLVSLVDDVYKMYKNTYNLIMKRQKSQFKNRQKV